VDRIFRQTRYLFFVGAQLHFPPTKEKTACMKDQTLLQCFKVLSSSELVQLARERIANDCRLQELVFALLASAKSEFWGELGVFTPDESVKLFLIYFNDTFSYFQRFKVLIAHSTWPLCWDFVNDFEQETRMSRAGKFLEALPNPRDKFGFARHVLQSIVDVQSSLPAQPPSPLHDTRNKMTIFNKRKRRCILQHILRVHTPAIWKSGVSMAFVPYMTEEEQADAWIVNHAKLSAYHLRMDYCDDCTFRSTCLVHSQCIVLVPLAVGWETVRGLVEKAAHLILLDGMTPVQSILFLLNIYGEAFLPLRILKTMSQNNPKNRFRALCWLVCEQRNVLTRSLESVDLCGSQEPELNKDVPRQRQVFDSLLDLKTSMIAKLKFSGMHLHTLISKTITSSGVRSRCEFVQARRLYPHTSSFIFKKMPVTAMVGKTMYIFRWNELSGFLECTTKIQCS
jgi:hypothetical protein